MRQIIAIAVLSLLVQLVFPWWSLAVVSFAICCWRSPGAGRAFVYGFVGVGIVWLLYALMIQLRTDGVFVGRMSELLFKTNGGVLPVLVTTLVSGLVGGLAGVAGFFVRQASGNQIANRIS
ncbi:MULTISPECIES: hypothetical protein [Spirosoma]|uniref:Uncharacterized protein n=1 Tax=Spirosoma sordidisoli TaxID=2502893 RepID=A0A4V1RVS2_9BACT|nr:MULTISPECIES: hypothetical protein [Spirosoma]RYC67758.1 hypothetical protein EQG79_23955 [Spirosoma sordidisoli]